MVLAQLECAGVKALGYTYADAGTAAVANSLLKLSRRAPQTI